MGDLHHLPGLGGVDPDDLDPEGAPWLQQVDAGEPDRAYEAFLQYADMPAGRRSLRKLTAARAGNDQETRSGSGRVVSSSIQVWAKKWSWVERARARDTRDRRVIELERLADAVEMRTRVAALAKVGLAVAGQKIQQNLRDGVTLTMSEAIRLFEVSAKLGLVANGEADSRVAIEPAADVAALSVLLETDAADALIQAARALAAEG